MVIKVYVSGISASKEVKKRQQRVLLMLDSFNVNYETIDITEPGREEERATVQHSFKSRTDDKRTPLPPQFFNDDDYCGDYEDFNAAVDVDQLYAFLKLEEPKTTNGFNGIDVNEDAKDTRNVSHNNENEIEGEKNEENLEPKQIENRKEIDAADDKAEKIKLEEDENETEILKEELESIESSKADESENERDREKQTEKLPEIPVNEAILEHRVLQEPQEEEEEEETEDEIVERNEEKQLTNVKSKENESEKVIGNEDEDEEEETESEEEESQVNDVVHKPDVKSEDTPSLKPIETKQNTDKVKDEEDETETEESEDEADD